MKEIIQTISTNLKSLSHPALVAYGTTLLSGLASNKNYPALSPTLDEARLQFGTYATAVADANKGGEAAIILRNSLRPGVEAIIQAWIIAAKEATPDQPALWAGAHFRLTKSTRDPRQPLAAPTKAVVEDGEFKGSVRFTQNAQATTRAYVYEYALVPDSGQEPVWRYCLNAKAAAEMTGLTSGMAYLFRMGAWNGTGDTVFSAAETRYVQ